MYVLCVIYPRSAIMCIYLLPRSPLTDAGSSIHISYIRLYICLYTHAGKDQFRAEVGPWMTLGQDALVSDDDYMPDFSAYVGKCCVVLCMFRVMHTLKYICVTLLFVSVYMM